MRIARHALIVCIAVIFFVGVPVCSTGYPQRKLSGVDAISSATTIIEQPSGAYVVLINKAFHADKEKLGVWENFFNGREIGFIFEDLSCVVADVDDAGMELARSFQSRLPENQMKLRREDVTLMMSKLEYGKFDVAFMSREVYDAYSSDGILDDKDVMKIEASGI